MQSTAKQSNAKLDIQKYVCMDSHEAQLVDIEATSTILNMHTTLTETQSNDGNASSFFLHDGRIE